MKSFLLMALGTFCTVIMVQSAYPQTGVITLDSVDGLIAPGVVATDTPVTFYLRMYNNTGSDIQLVSHAVQLYSPDGADWNTPSPFWNPEVDWQPYFGAVIAGMVGDPYSDSVAFLGFSPLGWPNAMPDGFNEIAFCIRTQISSNQRGRHICLDSLWGPDVDTLWMWGETLEGPLMKPTWDGPHCFSIGVSDVPSITHYGIAVLVVLLIVSSVWVIRRRAGKHAADLMT